MSSVRILVLVLREIRGSLVSRFGGGVDEISHLEVEEALALVAVHVRLVTVVAEALAVPLSHLR